MDTIDQVAIVASICATAAIAVIVLAWQLVRRDRPAERVNAYFRSTVTASLLSGSVALALLVWIMSAMRIRAVHHHCAYSIWFIAFLTNGMLGIMLAFLGGLILEKAIPSNHTLEPMPKGGRGSM